MTDELRAAPRTDAGKRLLKWEREGNVPWDVALECILEIETTILEPAPDVEALRARITTLVNQGPHWSPHPDIRDQVPSDPDWGASLVSVADIRAALTDPSHD